MFPECELKIPLQLFGIFSYFHCRLLTVTELHECDKAFNTPDSNDWNPNCLSFEQNERSMLDYDGEMSHPERRSNIPMQVEEESKDVFECKSVTAKKWSEAPNNSSKPFTIAYQSHGHGGPEHIILGNFGELNDEFIALIHDSAQLAGLTGEAYNMTPLDRTHDGKPSTTHLFKRRFFTAIGCMGVRIQSELLLPRLQFIHNSPKAAYSAVTVGVRRSYNSKYGSSTFSDKENADSYSNFRSCPHSYPHKA